MKCPHCRKAIHEQVKNSPIGEDLTSNWTLVYQTCPACKRYILALHERYDRYTVGSTHYYHSERSFLCYPKAVNRAPLPQEVPEKYAQDYHEACLTLSDSPKASAALSRRCLQHILRDEAKVKQGNLASEIQEILDSGKLPSHLLLSLDGVRNIGNFAAHPIKSTVSGEVIDVETGEAEWNLDVLEGLFDYFFVQPTIMQTKREALNAKLREAGKPEMKWPSNQLTEGTANELTDPKQ